MVLEHRAKVDAELRRPNPDRQLIENWEKRIQIVQTEILRLEERLHRY